jgi:S1-C subfamily serine protease
VHYNGKLIGQTTQDCGTAETTYAAAPPPPAPAAAPAPADIGSGVIIDTTKVLTANHVVKSCANITIRGLMRRRGFRSGTTEEDSDKEPEQSSGV